MKAAYLRFTEEINALDYLEKSYHFIRRVNKDKYAWKWVVLSLHGALYGFAICACRGTSNLVVVKENKRGIKRLINFDEALENCQNPKIMRMLTDSKWLVLTESQKESIWQLKKHLRNNFEHYQPMSWAIEIHGLPNIAIDILAIIRFLALDAGNYIHLSITQKRKIKSYVYQSNRILQNHKLYKELENSKVVK